MKNNDIMSALESACDFVERRRSALATVFVAALGGMGLWALWQRLSPPRREGPSPAAYAFLGFGLAVLGVVAWRVL